MHTNHGGELRKQRAMRAFTLVEMLIVVMVMMILAALVLMLTPYVNNKIGRGRAVRDLNQIKNALAAFHSTFGIFPPVNSPNMPHGRNTIDWEYWGTEPSSERPDRHYSTGLVYYLYSFDHTGKDAQPEGVQESKAWKHYLEEVVQFPGAAYKEMKGGFGYVFWTNGLGTFTDPWGRAYGYECFPPYQSFKMWSTGPETSTNSDDIGIRWDE